MPAVPIPVSVARGERVDFASCLRNSPRILMEGALGERLKREYSLHPDEHVALAGLVYDASGRAALNELWRSYADIANRYRLPFLATTPTRRANRERVNESRFDDSIMRDNVSFLCKVRQGTAAEMHVGGLMGCRGDAYSAADALPADKAREFHSWQAALFAETEVEFLYAGMMPTLSEAIGIAQAMSDVGLPYIISFMIRGNGRLLDGTTIHDGIATIDHAVATQPLCYMTNCVHPDVLYEALSQAPNMTSLVRERFWGIQANASPAAPEELDAATELRGSDPYVLADAMMLLRDDLKLKVFGGCCGTDQTHLEEIARRL
jgi:S-methylmethionine-dependent homocysteine/selenocysteine methylase